MLVCEEERGRVEHETEQELTGQLQLGRLRLVDAAGERFTLADFFAWTGVRKWTRRLRGSVQRIECRGWDDLGRDRAA